MVFCFFLASHHLDNFFPLIFFLSPQLKISPSFALLLQGKTPFVLDKYGGYIDHTNWENIAVSNLVSLEARIKIPLFSIRACLITNNSRKAAEECFGSTVMCFSTKMCL